METYDRDRILISDPEKYHHIEIRNLTYDDGKGLAGGYNGNVIVGYGNECKDIFFLSINNINQKTKEEIYDKVEEMFGQDQKPINLYVFNGESTIYSINEEDPRE